jgi:hypothetical protein
VVANTGRPTMDLMIDRGVTAVMMAVLLGPVVYV